MATTSKTLSYEEWLTLPEVEGVEEVVNGEIRKMPPNKLLHANTRRKSGRLAQGKVGSDGTVLVVSCDFRVGDSQKSA